MWENILGMSCEEMQMSKDHTGFEFTFLLHIKSSFLTFTRPCTAVYRVQRIAVLKWVVHDGKPQTQ